MRESETTSGYEEFLERMKSISENKVLLTAKVWIYLWVNFSSKKRWRDWQCFKSTEWY